MSGSSRECPVAPCGRAACPGKRPVPPLLLCVVARPLCYLSYLWSEATAAQRQPEALRL